MSSAAATPKKAALPFDQIMTLGALSGECEAVCIAGIVQDISMQITNE
jgi:hypothetical protein